MNDTAAQLSPGQEFAQEYGKHAVKDNLKAIKGTKVSGKAVVIIYLAASLFHQVHYLLDRGMDIGGAVALPIVFDIGMYTLAGVISTACMNRAAVLLAAWMLVLPTGASGFVNFVASPSVFLGAVWLAGAAVIVGMKLVAAKVGPDFAQLLAKEAEIGQATQVKPARTLGPEAAERRRTAMELRKGYAGMTVPQLQEQLRARGMKVGGSKKELVARLTETDQLQAAYAAKSAPVSPAGGVTQA